MTSNVAFNNNYYVLTLQNEKRKAVKHSFLIPINILYIRILLRIIPSVVGYLLSTLSQGYILIRWIMSIGLIQKLTSA